MKLTGSVLKILLRRHIKWCTIGWMVLQGVAGAAPRITTVVGTGVETANEPNGPRSTNVGNPFGVDLGPAGGLYICEVSNHRVWRWEPSSDELSIVAGSGRQGYTGDGGLATAAQLNEPYEVRFDRQGNMYFVEMNNHVVRKVDATTGIITTIAGDGTAGYGGDGGPATQSQLKRPHSIALDHHGSLFIADIGNHRIRRVELATEQITTFAGNGDKQLPSDGQRIAGNPVLGPRALFVMGRVLWVALREGHSVWKINLDKPRWRHVAGTGKEGYSGDGGPAVAATFNGPKGIAVDVRGDIYVVDTENQVIRQIDAKTQMIQTLAGSGPNERGGRGDGGPANQGQLNRPHGVCVDANGVVYIGDSENHRVRRVGNGL